jgi:hypothetical protein
MVSVRLQMDPESVATAGRALAGVAQRMADDVAALETTVLAPWGSDSPFGLAYEAVLRHALTALGSHVQQVGEAALTLAVQARSVAEADESAAAALHLGRGGT